MLGARSAVGVWLSALTVFALSWLPLPASAQNWLLTDTAPCTMFAPSITIDDGQGPTPVSLRLDGERIVVTTKSNIDAEFGDLGISVDNASMVPVDAVQETGVTITAGYDTLVKQFIAGREATVQLRFWPTWPTTGPKQASFSLLGFTKTYKAMSACR